MKATHNVKAYKNSMESTAGLAPFLGTYIAHENVPFEALCVQVAALCGLTAIQMRAILEGSFDAIAQLEKDGLVIVHLDGMSVMGIITGSFPTGDAPFDPARNALNLAIRLDDSVRLAIVSAAAQMVTDADLTKVRLDNIKDIEVERPVNLIHGRHVFRVAGFHLVLSDVGARVYLKDRAGTEHEVVVDSVHSTQLFTAHTAELLEGGDYTLWVESRGGDAEGPLQRDSCKVKYLRVPDPSPEPTFTGVYPAEYPGEEEFANVVYEDGDIVILGANLTDDMQVSLLKDGAEVAFTKGESTPTSIAGHIGGTLAVLDEFEFALKTADGRTVGTATIYCNEHP